VESATPDTTHVPSLADALAVEVHREHGRQVVEAEVHPGYDVFTIPHGGYLAALAGSAVLAATEQPDLFTITVHYLRKATEGPLRFEVDLVGGSRRFTTVHARGTQDGEAVLAVLASVGDRTALEGPSWRRAEPWDADAARLAPPAGSDGLGGGRATPGESAARFEPPNIARRFALRPDVPSFAFATGEVTGDATLRARMEVEEPDQLAALIACDITPPAVWNALGAEGWVPTIELTAHVRARPRPGPLSVVATTDHVTDGFLEEDAVVHDAEGRLVVQSRQLARWTGA
jgi:acyl-coenzyme A thioesterase PaaI-like protein